MQQAISKSTHNTVKSGEKEVEWGHTTFHPPTVLLLLLLGTTKSAFQKKIQFETPSLDEESCTEGQKYCAQHFLPFSYVAPQLWKNVDCTIHR